MEQRPSVAGVDDRPAARRDDALHRGTRGWTTQGEHGVALQPPEPGLAVLGEDLADGPPGGALDPLVQVDERRRVAVRQPPPDRGLAGPGSPTSTTSTGSVPRRRLAGRPRRDPRRRARPGRRRRPALGVPAIPRYRRRLSATSGIESPPVFSSTNRASVSITIASPITPAAGTTQMSDRS